MDINFTLLSGNETRNGKSMCEDYARLLNGCLNCTEKDAAKWLKAALKVGGKLGSRYGYTFLGAACFYGKEDVVAVVVEHLKKGKNSPLKGDWRKVLDEYDSHGYTPLLYAVWGGHKGICQILVNEGVDVNLPHQMSRLSPLLMAIEHSRDNIVTFLLENGACVNSRDNVGITPLYVAIKCQNEGVVKQLIAAECDVNIGSQDHTPIFLATRTGQLNIVKLLCEAGCVKDIRNKYGVTPVYEAALKGHKEVERYLLDSGCNPNCADMYEQTPLHVAVISNHLECVKLLLQAGANIKLRNHNRESAVDLALQMGKWEIVQYFLEQGLDVQPTSLNQNGVKNLVTVFERGHTATLEVLLRSCSKMPIPCCIGFLPMFRNQARLMKLLLHSGIETVPTILLAADTHQCTEILEELKTLHHNPRTLKDISRIQVRQALGNKVLFGIKHLDIPAELRDYLALKQI